MGKVTGFLEIERQEPRYEPASDRVRHFGEFTIPMSEAAVVDQASRCMDCGVPYCHGDTGCPVHNQIPDWNDLVYQQDWEEAARNLHSTNNFPEFTGRICPAPCEEACTLNLEDTPVAIKTVEQSIADKAIRNGWIKPQPPAARTGKTVAIVGSGPAGLAAAQQLARAGHDVHVYEREPKAGGLLRYGIPDFKMEKDHIDFRVEQMEAEGVTFHYNENIGVSRPLSDLQAAHDAVLLCGGSEHPRDVEAAGVELGGVHYAMPFLVQQNRRLGGEDVSHEEPLVAAGKHVVVVGGGDTASDCIGTAFRQGAIAVTQLDVRPQPPELEDKLTNWPNWAVKMRTSSSQSEGAIREFSAGTMEIIGNSLGRVIGVKVARVDRKRQPIPGTEFIIKADLVLMAIGFAHPVHEGMLTELDAQFDKRGNLFADTFSYQTSQKGVYAAGDMRRGQSLVVWAIREGRQAARAIDLDLMGKTDLPA
ncbi:glutamate synthase subunit beta [Paradevosia shaoguanensis]|jgi:glutamate synthase (NADPH/NADH) small chain|uniref:Glutamate synthase subunit beta n=1 Tax=Paradevosia shaoguanensis TaxID=1335043 RepID=A0AA41UI51_9HYPH|nr:glutamate synthase subunit beta [Paradevosia shaoguanensis]KFL26117.1 glutamate synthase [Devosia sp. 17-2-E-8]MCF1744513.1 glutamate synthase subunit beta [Paradevosia shaoguanensis]MCI0128996.1 glutamate synthase subunit beta [Paradevosia shaoguanensis]QMV00711.1 glutamate synthase small subunit [Devosia sp. D6-9]